ncbi:MAG TPA: hypothetical protein VIB79_18695, partial [Candidatus Binatia bacterium]
VGAERLRAALQGSSIELAQPRDAKRGNYLTTLRGELRKIPICFLAVRDEVNAAQILLADQAAGCLAKRRFFHDRLDRHR